MATPRSLANIRESDLEGKRVFLRVDLSLRADANYHNNRRIKAKEKASSDANLHQDKKKKLGTSLKVADVARFKKALPTIDYLIKRGARVIICGHIGQPEGVLPDCSLKPLVPILSKLINTDVEMLTWEDFHMRDFSVQNGSVRLLENVRFVEEEEKNDPEFAKKLASLADLYVNDDFKTAHRAHASTEGITRFLRPSVAGFSMKKELDWLVGAVSRPERPVAAIIGGLHVSSNIQAVEFLFEKVDMLFLGGRLSFLFINAMNFPEDSSHVELHRIAKSLIEKARGRDMKFILPSDILVADRVADDANSKNVATCAVPNGWIGVDIGKRSIERYCKRLDTVKTVIWTGVMGEYQTEKFAVGTNGIAKKLAELSKNGVTTIVGGSDTISAVRKVGLADKMTHVSTGGAASLLLLEGKQLPGVVALDH
ncbi:hypothetical protein MKW94_009810 [Papaver nudicaule]|uniref:Phosphoglycerate kinase n=1 Tax=Papaver nudicaule TaxID=74823 RepID=A0AA41RR66_PAPNU|nr:hypothetical protein [Papaver nudicaule]